jgi:hypothetical protein
MLSVSAAETLSTKIGVRDALRKTLGDTASI